MFWHKNKRILVGVSGGIAAYKSPVLVRRLVERGCDVRVIMTRAATEFITPLTLQAVSGHPVHQHLVDAEAESGMGHIELARWAEQLVIAPASADFIARLAHGRAEDLLSAVALATAAEVVLAPAMNQQMWQHPATQRNLMSVTERGVRVIGPGAGDQACGETGPGRMTEPEEIATSLAGPAQPRMLDGVEVLITAGPTWEAVDPVRGITNHSSGKMGYAMAKAALDFGARVTLVSGPVGLETPRGARRIDVQSARQMMDAVAAKAPQADIFIAVAAVADYRPAAVAEQKVKKKRERMTLELVRNPDILASVAAMQEGPFSVGFAAETENTIANARQKLIAKGIDVIAANQVSDSDFSSGGAFGGGVFGSDENAVTLLYRNARGSGEQGIGEQGIGEAVLAKSDKYRIAVQIIEHIVPLFTRFARFTRQRGPRAEPMNKG